MDISPFVISASQLEKLQLAQALMKSLIGSSVKMLVTNCSYFFRIGRQQHLERPLRYKVFQAEFSNQIISVKVQDHSEVSELIFPPVGDFPVTCNKWQHRSRGNASCNILLPLNVLSCETKGLAESLVFFNTSSLLGL